MGLFRRLFQSRAYIQKGGDVIWGNGNASSAGVSVTPDTAMGVSAVYACVRVRAETIASLPLFVYKRLKGGGKERATDHPLYEVLHDIPNIYQSSFEWREMLQGHAELRGNGYAQVIRDKGGRVIELIPLHPARTEPKMLPDQSVVYDYAPPTGQQRRFKADEIFHLKGLCSDGIKGQSPIDVAREPVGLTIATEQHGAMLFSNYAKPGGIIRHPGKITKEAASRLAERWQRDYAGVKNAHGTAVLEEGMDWKEIGLDNKAVQYIESRKFQIQEIARIFRIPPHMIGDLDRATFSNIEQQSIDFVTHSVRPWLVRWEQAISRCLLTPEERQVYFVEFLVDGLLRGDGLTRAQKLQIERMNGIINADEWREIENRNPLPDGKGQVYLEPLNMKEVGSEGNSPQQQPSQEPANPEPVAPVEEEKKHVARPVDVREAIQPLAEEAFRRLLTKEVKANRKRSLADIEAKGFYPEHRELCVEALMPVIRAALMVSGHDESFALDEAHFATKTLIEESQTALCDPDFDRKEMDSWPENRAKEAAERLLKRLFFGEK